MSKKPILLIAVLAALSFTTIHAQLNTSLGFKAGANFSTIIGDDAGAAGGYTAPYGGFIIRFTEADNEWLKYVVQGELYYSIQGSKSKAEKYTLSYVNLPILIQRYFGTSSFYLETGPQIGFLVSAKLKDLYVGNSDITKDCRKIDFCANFGFGYLTNTGLGIAARGSFGLTSFTKNYDLHNGVLSLGLYYVIGYGRSE